MIGHEEVHWIPIRGLLPVSFLFAPLMTRETKKEKSALIDGAT